MNSESKEFREQIRTLERKLGLLKKSSQSLDDGDFSLSLPQCHALVEIGRAHTISLKDLAKILFIDISTTSRTVDTLVKKELVLRTASKVDRRSIDIELTDEGKRLFNQIEESNNAFFANVFENIPINKRDNVIEALNDILNAME